MFWSEFESSYTNGAIRRCNMSGFGISHKILSQGLALPASITIDYHMNGRLYWIDRAKETIESANYDGTDHLIIASKYSLLMSTLLLFGFTLEKLLKIMMIIIFTACFQGYLAHLLTFVLHKFKQALMSVLQLCVLTRVKI